MRRSFLISGLVVILFFTLTSHGIAALAKISENVYSYVDAMGASPANGFGANAGMDYNRKGRRSGG